MKKSIILPFICSIAFGIIQLNAAVPPTTEEFQDAIKKGDVKLVQQLINRGADVNAKNELGWTPLHITTYKARIKNKDCEKSFDPSCFAFSKEHLKIAEILIKNGADVNENFQSSLLYHTVGQKNIQLAKLLIAKGANVNIANNSDKNTPLHAAVIDNDEELVKFLINKGANVNAKSEFGTPLHLAKTKEIVQILINNGADINIVDQYGYTPLHSNYNEELFKFLLSQVKDVDMKGIAPETPLQTMVERNNIPEVKLLIEHNADVNAKDINGIPVIAYAKNKEMIDLLVSKGAKTDNLITAIILNDTKTAEDFIKKGEYNVKGPNGRTALHYAVEYNNPKIAKLLIKKGVNVNAKDNSEYTPLHIAAFNGNLDIVKLLVKNGADVNAKCSGANPLYFAAMANNHKIMKYLIKNGAEVNTKLDNSRPVLVVPCIECHEEAIEILAKNKANLNMGTDYGLTLTEMVVSSSKCSLEKKERILKTLIKYGIDINENKAYMPLNALDSVIMNQDYEVEKMLIRLGAKSNYAIIWHANAGDKEMIMFLLENGFDINAKTKDGKTALDWEISEEMKQFLISHGAKSGKELK